ncbi:MAG: HAD hydrolase family protein [bacterium]
MSPLSRELYLNKLRDIRLLALDVDGVLTDDSIFFGPDGFELKKFNISDGFFIVLAMRAGLEIAVVSGRYSPATDTRMKDLGVKHVLQAMKSKIVQIKPLLDELSLDFDEIAFVGNELLDIGLARKAGLGIAVADATPELLQAVDYVTIQPGGAGAVREILRDWFEATGRDPMDFIV